MSPKAKHVLAREHLDRGLNGIEAKDSTEAVTWLFLSLEAVIVAVADRHEMDTRKQHWKKAEVAAELFGMGALPADFSTTLRVLNEARKVTTYEGGDPDLDGRSLEDLASDVAIAVAFAEAELGS